MSKEFHTVKRISKLIQEAVVFHVTGVTAEISYYYYYFFFIKFKYINSGGLFRLVVSGVMRHTKRCEFYLLLSYSYRSYGFMLSQPK